MRALAVLLACAPLALAGPIEVAIQVPLTPRIDMSAYDSVLVMNFLTDTTNIGNFNLNEETVKFFRNELKARATTKVLDPGEIPAIEGAPGTIFADTSYWQHVGGLYPGALLVTGHVKLKAEQRSGFITEEVVSPTTGIPVPVQRFKDSKYVILSLSMYFISGASGKVVHQEDIQEEMTYDNPDESVLYGYYDLMDRILPRFLGTIISQKYKEIRYLLE